MVLAVRIHVLIGLFLRGGPTWLAVRGKLAPRLLADQVLDGEERGG